MRHRTLRVIFILTTTALFSQSPELEEIPAVPTTAYSVLSDTIRERTGVLDDLTDNYETSRERIEEPRRFRSGTFGYYDSYAFLLADSAPVVVCDLDAPETLFSLALSLVGEHGVVFSGVPGDRSGAATTIQALPGADSIPLIVLLSGAPDHQEPTTQPRPTPPSAPPSRRWILGSGGSIAPLWVAQTISAVDGPNLSVSSVHALRLGFGSTYPSQKTLLDSGIPTVVLELAEGDHTGISELLFDLEHNFPAVRANDANYAMVPALRNRASPHVISEGMLLLSLVSIFTFMLLYAHIRPRRALRYVRAISRKLPIILLFFALMVASLFIANGVLRLLLSRSAQPLSAIPLTLVKVSFTVVFMALFFRAMHLRLSRSTTVYAAGAIFLILVAVLITAVTSLPVSFYLVLMFVAAFFFSLAPNAWLKGLTLIAALLPLAYLLAGAIALQDPRLTLAVVTPPFWYEALSAVFILPVFLMMLRLEHLTPRVSVLRIVTLMAMVTLTISGILIALEISDQPEILTIVEIRTPTQRSALISPLPPEGVTFIDTISGDFLDPCPGVPCTIALNADIPESERLVHASVVRRAELNRIVLDFTIRTSVPAQQVSIVVAAEEPLLLYRTTLSSDPGVGSTVQRFAFSTGPAPPTEIRQTFSFVGESLTVPIRIHVVGTFSGSPVAERDRPEFLALYVRGQTIESVTPEEN